MSASTRSMIKSRVQSVHFVAIGGIGMSGIAEILLSQGFHVTGSDISRSQNVRRLEKFGASIAIGHDAENLGNADVLIYSSAIASDNPELVEAKKRNIPIIQRGEMLAELMRMKESIAVAGSHGKTTTTSLIAWILSEAGTDPTCLVGGRLESFDSNARLGKSRLLVAEADESDGSFLKLTPVINIITNIDPEHLDHYGSFDELIKAFIRFANQVPFYGMNIVCLDHPTVRDIMPKIDRSCITYGFSEDALYRATNIENHGTSCSFTVLYNDKSLGDVKVPLPGRHNILNSLASIACAHELNIPFNDIKEALLSFKGIDRRFQVRGVSQGVTVIDDYAHHPSEIKATLKAAKAGFSGKIVALFQPHRYSRTQNLFHDFAGAFKNADMLYVCDIYAASEAPITGITSESLCEAITNSGHENAQYVGDKDKAVNAIYPDLEDGDLFITLGAGDVKNAAGTMLNKLLLAKGK